MEKIREGARVKVRYRLHEGSAEGPLIQETASGEPLEFVFGRGRMLPAFEAALEGLEAGAQFRFCLAPAEAYGPYRPEQVIRVPMELFDRTGEQKEKLLKKGNFLALSDREGRQHIGKVLEAGDEDVTMDFNHAMAGKTLCFEGEVLKVTTPESSGEEEAPH